jgi:hypothetical protein
MQSRHRRGEGAQYRDPASFKPYSRPASCPLASQESSTSKEE